MKKELKTSELLDKELTEKNPEDWFFNVYDREPFKSLIENINDLEEQLCQLQKKFDNHAHIGDDIFIKNG